MESPNWISIRDVLKRSDAIVGLARDARKALKALRRIGKSLSRFSSDKEAGDWREC
jgi:hypothetical protein